MKALFMGLALLLSVTVGGQVRDFGMWMSASGNAEIVDDLSLSVTPELRWDQQVTRLRNRFVDLKLKYKLKGDFFVVGAFRFGGVQRNSGWQPRRRIQFGAGYKWKMNDFTLTYISRFQFSFDVATVNRDADQNSNWRNKIDVNYRGVKKTPIGYSLEFFHGLNSADLLEFQDWRMIWSVGRKLTKQHTVELGYLLQKDRTTFPDEIDNIILLSYSFDFN